VDLLAVFRLAVLLALFLAALRWEELFFALVFFAELFFVEPFFGMRAPDWRASLKPIAMACLGFVTFLPLRPDESL
jgi:hypothetical protein